MFFNAMQYQGQVIMQPNQTLCFRNVAHDKHPKFAEKSVTLSIRLHEFESICKGKRTCFIFKQEIYFDSVQLETKTLTDLHKTLVNCLYLLA